ncbi:GyrI-like domain-containing protein [Solirubrobacter soli]|uniref:GyrI-like domain-containing protein n=1 Tax=Solirubrobacter soli TaxID=363832 RepID=UPI00069CD39D|nr:GyrI-like domain-containing protein [Solirubrobacter soli]
MEGVRPRQLSAPSGRVTAVVATATDWNEFPRLWRVLLDEVREHAQGRNVMVYLDDVPHVEVGVLPRGEFTPGGRVIQSELPAGPAVGMTHRGPYERLGETHEAVLRHIAEHGLVRTGVRWEIYGPWQEVPEVEVFWLVHADPGRLLEGETGDLVDLGAE